MKITFIGLGIMGHAMAGRLIDGGHHLTIFNRDREKGKDLIEKGAVFESMPENAVKDSELVFTMLSRQEVVEDLALGKNGFVDALPDSAVWVDCTTVDPDFVKGMAEKVKQAGKRYLEAPVLGTRGPAMSGELVFLLGGRQEEVDVVSLVLPLLGKKVIHLGLWGKAASLKLVVNLMLAQSILAFSEAVCFGKAIGLQENVIFDTLIGAPVTAPFLSNIREKLATKDTNPNFQLKWMAKDLGLITKMSAENNVEIPSAALTASIFDRALDEGGEQGEKWGDKDFSSILQFLNQ